MQTEFETNAQRQPFHISWRLGFWLFAAIAFFFLWNEHRAHILGALPYLLLLLCPFMHLFMHRGHGGHGGGAREGHGEHQHEGGVP